MLAAARFKISTFYYNHLKGLFRLYYWLLRLYTKNKNRQESAFSIIDLRVVCL
jgi:hypothetical protein